MTSRQEVRKETHMKPVLLMFLAFSSISAFADSVWCSGRSPLKAYYVYFKGIASDRPFATINVIEFHRINSHYGDLLLEGEVVAKESDTNKSFLSFTGPTGSNSVNGYVNLATGKGRVKIAGPGFRRNIRLSGCESQP